MKRYYCTALPLNDVDMCSILAELNLRTRVRSCHSRAETPFIMPVRLAFFVTIK